MSSLQDGSAGALTGVAGANAGPAARIAALFYAQFGVALTIGFWAYFVIFVANAPRLERVWAKPSVDVGSGLADPYAAAAVNLALLSLFGLQHSLMARDCFKRWIAFAPAFERVHYVYASNVALILLVVCWQPIPHLVWDIQIKPLATAVWVLFALAWLFLFLSAFSFGLAELLGLTQVRAWLDGRPPQPLRLRRHWLYDRVRHPMYLGAVVGVWATPRMTVGDALLAAGFTVYVLIGLRYEERDLERAHGAEYRHWRGNRPAAP